MSTPDNFNQNQVETLDWIAEEALELLRNSDDVIGQLMAVMRAIFMDTSELTYINKLASCGRHIGDDWACHLQDQIKDLQGRLNAVGAAIAKAQGGAQ